METDSCDPFAADSQIVWGLLGSLYGSLESETISRLEKAVYLRHIRAFDESIRIFESLPSSHKYNPIIVSEHFSALWCQWRVKDAAHLIGHVLDYAETNDASFQENGPYTLLRVLRAKSYLFHQGSWVKGRDSLIEIRRWLYGIAPESYTDLQTAKTEVVRSFIAACDKNPITQPVWWLKGKAYLQLATALGLPDNGEERTPEVGRAENEFNKGLLNEPHRNIFFEVRITELRLRAQEEPSILLMEWTSFVDLIGKARDFYLEMTALQEVLSITTRLYSNHPNGSSYETFASVWLRSSSLLEELGDVHFLVLSRYYADIVATARGDYKSILKWHEDFESNNPYFQLWDLQILSNQCKIGVYAIWRQHEKVYENLALSNKIATERTEFWAIADVFQNLSPLSPPKVYQFMTSSRADQKSDEEDLWYTEGLQHAYGGHAQPDSDQSKHLSGNIIDSNTPSFWRTLLSWIRTDFRSQKIEKHCVEKVLGLSESFPEPELWSLLDELNAEGFAELLLGNDTDPLTIEEWTKSWDAFSSWLLNNESHDEAKRHYLLCLVQDARIASLAGTDNEAKFIEFDRIEKLMPSLCTTVQTRRLGSLPRLRNAMACAKMSRGNKHLEPAFPMSGHLHQEILDMFQISLTELQQLGSTREEANTHVLMAVLNRQQALLCHQANGSASATNLALFQNALDHLHSAETLYLQAQESYKAFEGWEAVDKMRHAAEDDEANRIFPLSISILSEMPDSENRSLKMWLWMQKSKAQGLPRLMGSYSMIEQAQELIQEADHAPEIDKIQISERHTTDSDLEQLFNLSRATGTPVVFIEWYSNLTSPYVKDQIFAAVIRPEKPVKTFKISMSLSEMSEITDRLFSIDERDLKDTEVVKEFQKLAPLIEPLRECSNPGDTIVLVPSENMHHVPLHALKLDAEVLIRRNPTVYSSSISMLLNNFNRRTSHEQEVRDATLPWQASVFGDPTLSASPTAISIVATNLGVVPNHFTRTAFTSSLLFTSLIHYHGSADFHGPRPLDHCLTFADAPLAVREIFNLATSRPLKTSYHATILGCNPSGNSNSSSGSGSGASNHHPLFGMVPSFQYTGAASVVSALWNLDDTDAASFSRTFYNNFASRRRKDGSSAPSSLSKYAAGTKLTQILEVDEVEVEGEGGGLEGYLNLALMYQKAVLALMEEKPAMRHWAGIVFNGWWMYRDP
ncbi:hypothetical protein MMC07_006840 [Pseudocyphellaria aurata]|nr:hypothetical protein [Pseudocyphellaria aurata]